MAVVNPAKRLQSDIEPGLETLRKWGLEPVIGQYTEGAHNLFSGTDHERLTDLQWALDDPEIRAIVMARGGYGTTRIVDQLNFDGFLEYPKWVCGFSDITSLLCKLDNLSVSAVHGPVAASLNRNSASDNYLGQLLFGHDLHYAVKPRKGSTQGLAKGMLIGGNLTMICNSIGTASEIDTNKKILFLEEVGEYIYHLDRMLVHLQRAGKFDNLAGIIVGDFSSMKDHNDTFGHSTYEVLKLHLDQLDCPVLYGFPAGHESVNFPLPFGVNSELRISDTEATLTFNLSGNQPANQPG